MRKHRCCRCSMRALEEMIAERRAARDRLDIEIGAIKEGIRRAVDEAAPTTGGGDG